MEAAVIQYVVVGVVQVRAGDKLEIRVKGRGCALLTAFRDLN